jgi:hypothetical protein
VPLDLLVGFTVFLAQAVGETVDDVQVARLQVREDVPAEREELFDHGDRRIDVGDDDGRFPPRERSPDDLRGQPPVAGAVVATQEDERVRRDPSWDERVERRDARGELLETESPGEGLVASRRGVPTAPRTERRPVCSPDGAVRDVVPAERTPPVAGRRRSRRDRPVHGPG